MPGAILRSGSIVSAWKIKRTSSPRALKAFATASATRTSRRLPAWMFPETLMPLTTTCGPAPRESATLSAQTGMGKPVELPVSLMQCSNWGPWSKKRSGSGDLAGRLDVHDLVLRRAAGGGDSDLLPHLLLQDGPAHRGGVAELPARRVGLVGANDPECPLLPLPNDPERHGGTEIHRVFLGLRGIYHPHVAYPALQLADSALQQALLVLGIIVLGVLRDVPELASLTDAIGDLPASHIGQVCKFLLELLHPLRGDKLLIPVLHKPRDYKGG